MGHSIGFFSRRNQRSIDIMDDIFCENAGIVFLIQNNETKLWLLKNELPFLPEYTDDPNKALRFKTSPRAHAFCIEHDIFNSHDVKEHRI